MKIDLKTFEKSAIDVLFTSGVFLQVIRFSFSRHLFLSVRTRHEES